MSMLCPTASKSARDLDWRSGDGQSIAAFVTPAGGFDDKRIARVVDFVQAHCDETITLHLWRDAMLPFEDSGRTVGVGMMGLGEGHRPGIGDGFSALMGHAEAIIAAARDQK
ncbi:MAG: hypothetical protein AAF264_01255, partial [Pseudomonadota bacterium]